MINLAPHNQSSKTKSLKAHDTVQIMRDGFQPNQLRQLVEVLEEDGHRCALFQGSNEIGAALINPRTKLLLIGVDSTETSQPIDAIKSVIGVHDVPVLIYFNQPSVEYLKDVLTPEIEDFLLAPLCLQDLRLRVNRLSQRFLGCHDDMEHAKQSLLSHFGMQQLIGSAPSFLATIKKIPRVATCNATVLLTGDTGTGKEVCARAIHYLSSRANKPFVPVNCGSIPPELFENELFGHEPGAFTDARQSRRGLIAETEGGTLFLDEVDSLPLSAQVKLLRFLQERQYRPLGGRYRQADIRVLAATNQNLLAKVQSGAFREDLFYRLKVVTLGLPPLRDRREDILPLAHHFLQTSASEYQRPAKQFSQGAIQELTSYTWPGNIRELENAVHQAVVLATGAVIRGRDLQLTIEVSPPSASPFKESLKAAKARVVEEFERTYLEETLAACGGNISKAARRAQKDRRSFFALLKKYDLTHNHSY